MEGTPRVLPDHRPEDGAVLRWSLAGLVLAILVSLAFVHAPGTYDVDTWLNVRWLPQAERFGIIRGYARAHDNYPPLSFVVIALVGRSADALSVDRFVIFKLCLFAFLLATTLATYRITRSVRAAAAMHLLLTVSSMMHGYTDIFYAPFLVASLHLMRDDRLAAASTVFTLGALMKYQPLILAPILALHVAAGGRQPLAWRRAAQRLIALALPALVLIVAARRIFGKWFSGAFLTAMRGHDWLSAQALNANWIAATWIAPDDPLSVHMQDGPLYKLPKLAFLAALALSLVFYWRSRRDFDSALVYASLGYLGYFMFNPSVHENHLFPAAVTCTLAASRDGARFGFLIYWPIAAIFNHVLLYGFVGTGFPFRRDIAGVDLTVMFALLNLVAYARTVWLLRPAATAALRQAPQAA